MVNIEIIDNKLERALAVIGHCRMVTNGSKIIRENTHAIMIGETAGIHNCILINDGDLWSAYPNQRRGQDDDGDPIFAQTHLIRVSTPPAGGR